jgi:peptidoglycan DL-endopeptidase CwlO
MPPSGHVPRQLAHAAGRARRRLAGRLMIVAGAVAVSAGILPAGSAGAAPAHSAGSPSINAIIAKANVLSEQIDNLSEQYDGLKIQLTQAQSEVKIAQEDAARDGRLLGQDLVYLDNVAVESYMTAGFNPALQLLQSSSPQTLLNRASIMTQLEQQNGDQVSLVANAATAAQRAQAAAAQVEQHAKELAGQMAAKVSQIQQRENFFNSAAFAQAEAVFQQTGHYPDIDPVGDSVGVQALRFALTRLGDMYVWGAAGPTTFDCSGLVVWAYAQIGITLEHFTGDLWNEVVHIPSSELEPGDLVFFYPNIGHVGIYVGKGLMVDAPTFGQPVQIQPVMWNVFVGAGYVPA